MCTVPNLVGKMSSQAPNLWTAAGFTLPISFQPLTPPQYRIGSQNIAAGISRQCGTTIITVTP